MLQGNFQRTAMSTGKISKNCIEAFFQAVSKGSVPNLQKLLKKHKPHEDEEAMIVNSFNSGGETVGIQNSTTTCLTRASSFVPESDAISCRSLQVREDSLDSLPVRPGGMTGKLGDLINSEGDVWSGASDGIDE